MSILRFGIIGKYQAGKSLLINCLLGRHVTTVGKGDGTTHAVVSYFYSPNEFIEIIDTNGKIENKPIEYLTQEDTNENISQINVYLDSPFLKNVSLIDTPGVDYHSEDNKKALNAIRSLDYAIVLISNFKTLSYDDPLYETLSSLNRYSIPFYWFLNCNDATSSEKWDTDSDINKMIGKKDDALLQAFQPMLFPYVNAPIRIVNLIWYWYSICPNPDDDEIIKPYIEHIKGDGISEATNDEICYASNFFLILELFNMDNRAYLELKKELQFEIAKLRMELCPIGTIQTFSYNSIPAGWLFCNGESLEIHSFPELYEKIGATYGGDGKTTFKIPDLRGQFIRGWDDRTQRGFGSQQLDALQDHSHKIAPSETQPSGEHNHKVYYTVYKVGSNTFKDNDMNVYEVSGTFDSSHSFGGDPGTSSSGKHIHSIPELSTSETIAKDNQKLRISEETRPINTALLYCIKVI